MAKLKISELPAAAALDGTEPIPVVQDGETVQTTAQDIADLGGGGAAAYLVYTALLTQSGTDAPVATVLENTLGGTVVWSYEGIGTYDATLSAAFTENKTVVIVGTYADTNGNIVAYRDSENVVTVQSAENDSDADGLLFDTAIEIRVYP